MNSYPVSRFILRFIKDTFDAEVKLTTEVDKDVIIYKTAGGTGYRITIEQLYVTVPPWKENE